MTPPHLTGLDECCTGDSSTNHCPSHGECCTGGPSTDHCPSHGECYTGGPSTDHWPSHGECCTGDPSTGHWPCSGESCTGGPSTGHWPFSLSFQFSSRWYHSAGKGPYRLLPVSQQSPQGCPRNSTNVCLAELRSFSTLEGAMLAASFLHSSVL